MAGVVKVVEGLRRGVVAGSLHVGVPTSRVDWSVGGVEVVRESVAWPEVVGRVRRAGVSSFGISGTNAHVILEQAGPDADWSGARDLPAAGGSPHDGAAAAGVPPTVVPWLVAARSEDALRAQATRLAAFLPSGVPAPETGTAPGTAQPLVDVGYSLATGRAALPSRAAVVATDLDGATRGLAALARGESTPTVERATVSAPGRTALLFTGQGSQRPGMGRELYRRFPVFAECYDQVRAHLDPLLDSPLDDVVDDPERLDRTENTQPALFALEVALYGLLRAWGVAPDVVAGHSIGEIAAAHVAGVLSLPDACALVAARGRLMAAAPGGAMLAVEATEREVRAWLRAIPRGAAASDIGTADVEAAGDVDVTGDIDVAAVNGPTSVVLSGTVAAVAAVAVLADRAGRRTRRLRVAHAFHSPLMDGMLEPFRRVAESLRYQAPTVALVSTVTGRSVSAAELCGADYWVRQARAAVRFGDAVTCLRERGVTTFLELGPTGVLSAMGRACAADGDAVFIPTLRADRSEEHALVTALSRAHVHGVDIDWASFFAGTRARRVDLPTYAFQRRRYWLTPSPVIADSADSGGLADETAGSGADDLTYRIAWTPVTVPTAPVLSGTWIVAIPPLPEAARLADECAQVLELRGARVVRLAVDGSDTDRGRLAGRLAALTGTHQPIPDDIRGVLSLASMDTTALGTHPVLPTGLALTVALLQALGDVGVSAPLWCATSGAVSTGAGDPPSGQAQVLAQAQVWGLGRVAALEMPGRWGGLVDLPGALGPRAAEGLAAVLTGICGEDQVALRPAGLFARRIVRARGGPGAVTDGSRWRPRGTVLITGGTGALGSEVARWCAAEGARRLVLTSRRGLAAPGAAELAAELTRLGAEVTVAACDVTDRDALAEIIATVPADQPLTAVVHAAGSGDGAVLERTTPAELAAVVAAKTTGAAHLDDLLAGQPLDAFVLFSSVAGIWGNPGQSAYAGANAWLDALAERRGARGLPATSVAWGPWAGAGMADDPRVRERTERHGLPPLAPEVALRALAQVVGRAEPGVVVARVDWERFVAAFPPDRTTRFVDEIPAARAAAARGRDGRSRIAGEGPDDLLAAGLSSAGLPSAGLASPRSVGLRDRLASVPASGRHRLLLGLVRSEVAAVLGHASPEDIPADRAFTDLGFDSLTSVETRNRLAQATGEQLPAVVVFDHPTPDALARHLLTLLSPEESGLGTSGPEPILATLDRLEASMLAGSPDEQARAALETRLRAMLRTLRGQAPAGGDGPAADTATEDLGAATDEEMFDLLGREFGIS
ncbi:Phosphopantetheine attachment site [Parafrankia irregularis]|uniref:Phosphopantetheine attachment site n=1 Tax=Parafrankia irregularis TaxID=795642 RepID=A0A0S4QMM3_9ACTN|nr:Phosphopantetheine attachment site [Parafrankia irregularis]